MTNKKFGDLLRRAAAYALIAAFTVNPLAAQERYYFRNVQGSGSAGSTAPPTNPLSGTLSMASANVTVGQSVNLVPVAQNIPLPITWTLTGTLPGNLSFNPATGAVTGEPSSPGTTSLTLTAKNGSAQAVASFSITASPVVANPPVIASYPSSFTVVAGETLSIAGPSVTNGKAPFSYGIIPLNPPFTFSEATGAISWTPTAPATVGGITVRVTDADQASDVSNPFSIVVNPALTAGSYGGTKELIVGDLANFPLVGAGGGNGTLAFVAAGLPSGLSVGSGGTIVGNANVQGDYSGTVTVSDVDGRQQAASFLATIYPALSASLSAPLPASATRNSPIGPIDLVVTGGKTPYTYTTAGNFPPGLNFSNGTLSGSPLTAGTYEFELLASETLRGVQVSSGTLSLVVTNPILAIQVSPQPPSSANVGVGIEAFKATATGGTAPYTYELEGELPPGLSMATDGTVSGTPSVAAAGQAYSFGIRVTDSTQPTPSTLVAGSYGINVTDASPIQVAYSATYEGSAGVTGTIPAPAVSGGSGAISHVVSGTGVSMTTGTGAATFSFASAGTYGPYTVTSTDTIGRTKTSNFSVEIKTPPSVTTAALPVATQGQAFYSATLGASGGTAPYSTWTLKIAGTTIGNNATIGNTGLVWKTNGTITGSVAAAASSQANLVFTATDSFGRTSAASAAMSLNVAAKASAPTYPSTTNTTIGETSIIAPLAASVGGTAPLTYGWSTPPSNTSDITINPSNGQITVAPTLPAGTYSFTVAATDANGVVGATSLSRAVVSATKPTITTASLPGASQGAAYSHTLAWSGGSGTLNSFVLTNNGTTVSNGATIGNTNLVWNANTGSITGTVGAAASPQPNLSVTVSDNAGRTSTAKPIPLTMNLVPSAPTYAAKSATINVATTASPSTLSTGGSGGTTYEIVSVTPASAGITMANATTGQIAINVTSAVAYTVNVRARDSAGTPSASNASFVISATAAVTPYLSGSQSVTPGQSFGGQILATGGNNNFLPSSGGWRRVTHNGTTITATTSGSAIGSFPGLGIPIYGDMSYGAAVPVGVKSLIGVVLEARDSVGNTGSTTINILANLVAPTYPATTNASTGTATTITRTTPAYGGTGALSYSVASTPSNAGITVDASGNVAVAASVPAGTYSLVVTATDGGTPSVGSISSTAFTVSVAPAITIDTVSLPAATLGVSYSFQVAASGGSGALSYSATPRPAGLTMSTTGLITGTPTTVQSVSMVVTATDGFGRTTNKTLPISVNAPALVAATYPATIAATLGTLLTIPQNAAPSGGTGAKTYSVAASPSNSGITVNSSGVVSIAATVPQGTYSITVTTTDAGTPTPQTAASSPISVSVAPPITIDTASLPAATVGTAYSFQMVATGGSGTLSFSSTGRPPGINMSSTGLLSGTPTTNGTYSVVTTVTDVAGRTSQKTLSMVVAAAVLVAPTYPASSGATLGTVRTIPVTTAASGGTGAKTYTVASTPSNAGITIDTSGTVSIASSVTSGTYSVVVTTTDAGTPTPQTVASAPISVSVAPAITITTNTVDSQAVDAPYYFQIVASGGSGTLSFLGTNMPPGMYIDAAGVIRGTPTAQGSYVFTVEAYDAFGRTISKNFSMTIGPANTMLLKLGKNYYDGTVPKETLYVCDGYVPNSVCSSGGPSPAMLHYEMTPNSAGQFTVYVHHSTADSRPVNIYVNGTLILHNVAAGTNGTYYAPTAQYNVGRVYLNAGTNTVSIQTTTPGGALPHIEWLQLMP